MRVTWRLVLAIAAAAPFVWCGQGCGSGDLNSYDYAVEIRRDAKVLLTTRPSSFELITADAADR